ncbi:hypothetical protein GNI_089540 [Gregarina niphandrodes]|uniref:Uncharacterized protein n=1 Tax=Gregarina niphandrodes TaxID=110365 RepID=A0A023B5N0_GRENI|nr:hypothetical protein GNI_089540 [Gregarina niphandrodes]EZG61151.1 hypothetical protein GNI_089540 [Gregarina niphandrodes]|eukprot:XP_011130804.1 hypothetical protein GNI_089540 [Gregarina niphandrodes]
MRTGQALLIEEKSNPSGTKSGGAFHILLAHNGGSYMFELGVSVHNKELMERYHEKSALRNALARLQLAGHGTSLIEHCHNWYNPFLKLATDPLKSELQGELTSLMTLGVSGQTVDEVLEQISSK